MKKIVNIIILVIVIISLGTIIIGNYFVDFALYRKEDLDDESLEMDLDLEEYHKNRDDIIKKNLDKINRSKDEWLKEAEKEKMNINSHDGLKLVANIYPKHSNDWVILIHGYTGNKEELLSYAKIYADWDYNVLMPDLRAHGESQGDYMGMGWLDRKDMLLWIDKIVEKDPESKIIMHGISMGAATVMMTAGEDLPENVKGFIEDCGYTSVWDIFADKLNEWFNLPEFPVMYMSDLMTRFKAGYSLKASSLDQLKKSDLPILFIHGSDDDFVPTYMIDECYEAKAGDKEYLIIEDAGHGEAFYREPDKYFNTIKIFIEEYAN